MCHVGRALGRDLGEVGELDESEVNTWAAWLARQRVLEDQRWDRRFLGVCRAIAAVWITGVRFDPKMFYPAMFDRDEATKERRGMSKAELEQWFEDHDKEIRNAEHQN